jgi:hypothetical protein
MFLICPLSVVFCPFYVVTPALRFGHGDGVHVEFGKGLGNGGRELVALPTSFPILRSSCDATGDRILVLYWQQGPCQQLLKETLTSVQKRTLRV